MTDFSPLDLKEVAKRLGQIALGAVEPERLVTENVIRDGQRLVIGGQKLNLDDFEK